MYHQELMFIKWKFYQKNVHTVLEKEAVTENKFSDITIVSDDMINYSVHKFFLGAVVQC